MQVAGDPRHGDCCELDPHPADHPTTTNRDLADSAQFLDSIRGDRRRPHRPLAVHATLSSGQILFVGRRGDRINQRHRLETLSRATCRGCKGRRDMTSFRIGEIAELTGVSVETLRYYERMKLLPVTPRTRGGIRRYDAATV